MGGKESWISVSVGRAQPFGIPGKQEASAHAHRSEMLKNPPDPLTDGKQKSLIHEEGMTEAWAICGAEKLDQSDLGLRLTERMDCRLHGKNPNNSKQGFLCSGEFSSLSGMMLRVLSAVSQ